MISNYTIIGFALFSFAINLAIGIAASIRPQSREIYFLGGRKVTSFILATTFTSTSMSGLLFLGFSGMIYEEGMQSLWMVVPSATIGIYLCYRLISRRIRMYSEYIGALTIIEVMKKRYEDKNNILSLITGFMIVLATIMYVSGQLIAAGKLINLTTGLSYEYSIIVFAVVMITYVAIGGFNAVCWTDVFQGVSMVIGSLLAGLTVLYLSRGIRPIWQGMKLANSLDPNFYLTAFNRPGNILLGITIFLGDGIMNWIGQPTLMTKYMSADSYKSLRTARNFSLAFQMILFGGVFLSTIYMKTQFINPDSLPLTGDTETVFIQFFMTMMNPFWSGIVLGGIIAAIMSTADSLIMLSSSTIVNDLYYIKKPKSSSKELILISRITTFFLGIIVIFIALVTQSVLTTAWIGWSILGIAGVPIVVGLYWERATLKGAIWAQILGSASLLLWVALDLTTRYNIFYAFAAGAVSYATIITVSLLSQPPSEYIRQEIRELKKGFEYKGHIEM